MKKDFKNKNLYFSVLFVGVFFVGLYFIASPKECIGEDCSPKGSSLGVFSRYDTFPEMDPRVLSKKIENDEIFLLDVRELDEWNEGYIEGANLLPLGQINAISTVGIPKDKPVYVYCRSGNRAVSAVQKLKALGFDAKNIGGINHFLERGGKLVK